MRLPPLVCALIVTWILVDLVQARDEPTLALRNVTVIDGNGGSPLPGRTIVIRSGRIVEISAADNDRFEPGPHWMNLDGHYGIPGLVDSDVHLSLSTDDPAAALEAAFNGGVTAVRDMGGDETLVRRLAERTRDNGIREPRIYFATALRGSAALEGPGARQLALVHRPAVPLWLQTIVEESQIDSLVVRARNVGATGIKVYSDLPLNALKMLCARARREGLRVWGHARVYPHRPSDGLEAGLEVLSHGSQLAFEETNGPDNGDVYRLVRPDSAAITRLLQDMRARGAILEPTLHASYAIARAGGIDPSHLRRVPSFAWACDVTRRARELGVTLVAGTDRLNERGASRLPSIHTELELLVSHGGLTPLEAITAATRTAALVLGNDDSYGTIGVGKWADIAIVRADPSKDIRNSRTVAFVVKAGVLHRVGGAGRTAPRHQTLPRG